MDHLVSAIRRHPVTAFYILAFVLSWLGWFPQALYGRGLFPFDHPLLSLLGGVGPTLAAIIVTLVSKEGDGIRKLFGPLFALRASFWWFAFAFGFWIVVTALALGIGTIFGQTFPALSQFAWVSLLPIFVTMLFSNVWEEIGWRGFALPRLQTGHGDLTIVFLMGFLWSLWHLPLLLNPASPMSQLPWYGEIIFSLSLTTIYTWLYQNTARSLFFVTVFHAMSNTMASVLLELGVFASSYLFVVGVTTIVAIIIVLSYGTQRFIVTIQR
jgi:membrane protease YdiL (CAAX protease family)